MLRGLRSEVPDYVHDVLEGRIPPAWVTDHLGGIVVIPDADVPTTAAGRNTDGGERRLLLDLPETSQMRSDPPGQAA